MSALTWHLSVIVLGPDTAPMLILLLLQAKLALLVKDAARKVAHDEAEDTAGFLRELTRISSPSETTLPSEVT
jgi:hypothetical protein